MGSAESIEPTPTRPLNVSCIQTHRLVITWYLITHIICKTPTHYLKVSEDVISFGSLHYNHHKILSNFYLGLKKKCEMNIASQFSELTLLDHVCKNALVTHATFFCELKRPKKRLLIFKS